MQEFDEQTLSEIHAYSLDRQYGRRHRNLFARIYDGLALLGGLALMMTR